MVKNAICFFEKDIPQYAIFKHEGTSVSSAAYDTLDDLAEAVETDEFFKEAIRNAPLEKLKVLDNQLYMMYLGSAKENLTSTRRHYFLRWTGNLLEVREGTEGAVKMPVLGKAIWPFYGSDEVVIDEHQLRILSTLHQIVVKTWTGDGPGRRYRILFSYKPFTREVEYGEITDSSHVEAIGKVIQNMTTLKVMFVKNDDGIYKPATL